MADQTEHTAAEHPEPSVPNEPLRLGPCGGYKDKKHTLVDLPEVELWRSDEAAERLRVLKTRVNELQVIREGFWKKQTQTGAAGVASAVVTLGVGMIAAGAVGVHNKKKIDEVKEEMLKIILQVVQIRARFGTEPVVLLVEEQVRIVKEVFDKDIKREELTGDL